ncbi:MAG: Uma2 family endonuclease [Xenococcaceae cyanobacterium]
MTQAIPKLLTFEEFLHWKPEGRQYELHEGIIIEMQPTGKHEEITGFLTTELAVEYKRLKLPYFIPKTALVKAIDRQSAYSPDVLILNRPALKNETLWEKYSTVQTAESIPLIIEVVSTNWRDDYLTKLRDYEEIGIKEYWIVDYLASGGRRYIGNPKQPTISIYQLVEGEYQVNRFRESDRLNSTVFPNLDLTVNRIFQAGED